jgi:hypothetical protein
MEKEVPTEVTSFSRSALILGKALVDLIANLMGRDFASLLCERLLITTLQ